MLITSSRGWSSSLTSLAMMLELIISKPKSSFPGSPVSNHSVLTRGSRTRNRTTDGSLPQTSRHPVQVPAWVLEPDCMPQARPLPFLKPTGCSCAAPKTLPTSAAAWTLCSDGGDGCPLIPTHRPRHDAVGHGVPKRALPLWTARRVGSRRPLASKAVSRRTSVGQWVVGAAGSLDRLQSRARLR